jgi:hypothetical protein
MESAALAVMVRLTFIWNHHIHSFFFFFFSKSLLFIVLQVTSYVYDAGNLTSWRDALAPDTTFSRSALSPSMD